MERRLGRALHVSAGAWFPLDAMPPRRTRVLIVDDHPVFRDGLRQSLEARKTFRVVGAVESGEAMREVISGDEPPDVVLMDVELPGESGIDLTKALRDDMPELPVVMLTAHSETDRVLAALKAGAVGYLLKNASPSEIAKTVETAARGEPILSGEMAGRVLREFERERVEIRDRAVLDTLTAREEEILRLLATGESNREIAGRLSISEQTVKNHVASIFRKLHVNDRTKAALLAVRLGLADE